MNNYIISYVSAGREAVLSGESSWNCSASCELLKYTSFLEVFEISAT